MTATWETARLRGELHLFVALDWGESINLERARQALPGELQSLPRRPRTPASIGYSLPRCYTVCHSTSSHSHRLAQCKPLAS